MLDKYDNKESVSKGTVVLSEKRNICLLTTFNKPFETHGWRHSRCRTYCTNKAQQPGQVFKAANILTVVAFCSNIYKKKTSRNSGEVQ